MKLPELAFTTTDWSTVPRTEHAGETGTAWWQTFTAGDLRVRMVEYSPGYLADHWCDRGHVFYLLTGDVAVELQDGRVYALAAGHGFAASDHGDAAHRVRSQQGGVAFIVD